MHDTTEFRRAREMAVAAADAANAVARTTFPVGSDIAWFRGRSRNVGKVVDHGYGRVRVENASTGREYWVNHTAIDAG